jgi:cytosine/adenosine deaminase-related metal-dependent hydrolase
MIIRARVVATMDGSPIKNGAVVVSADRIVDVGKFSEVSTQHSGEKIIDLGEQLLLPGLINAHCHLDYTCLRRKIPRQKLFTDWIRAINAEKLKLSPECYIASINEGFVEAKQFGTTTIANLTAFPDLIRHFPDASIRTWWFAELIDVRSPDCAIEFVGFAIESLRSVQNCGLAPHALFTASKTLYERCEQADADLLLTTHLAESREEMEMFRDASGPLYEFMKNIGRDMRDCGHETPLRSFVGALGSRTLPNRWIVAHLNELTKGDFELLEKLTTKFHIAHSPRSHEYFGHSPFQSERLRRLGFNICLGTDSLASNENLSLFAEMRAFQRSRPGSPPEEILAMVTVNPAAALHQENALGRIRPGFRADLIAIPSREGRDAFDEIIAFDGSVEWIMVNGKMQANGK